MVSKENLYYSYLIFMYLSLTSINFLLSMNLSVIFFIVESTSQWQSPNHIMDLHWFASLNTTTKGNLIYPPTNTHRPLQREHHQPMKETTK